MKLDPRRLRVSECLRLLNSTSLGEVVQSHVVYGHMNRAGLRISSQDDQQRIDLVRYAAWLFNLRRNPKSDPGAERSNYESIKEAANKRSKKISSASRDIGPLPAVVNPQRKESCRLDFRAFCERYFPAVFHLPWSSDHIKVINKMQAAILEGGLFALAMPRATGKTVLALTACLWALLYGHRRFVALIAASEEAATDLLDDIKAEIETNSALAEDFPEVCHPIRSLDGIVNRSAGQLVNGERTRIEWTAKRLVLPTIEGSAASGGIVRVAGITGRIRGMKVTRPSDGASVRPDCCIVDDPSTDESARSPSQCTQRLNVVNGAILGLAGPGEKIAGFMPCTVICKGDLADQILDPEKSPEWQGERTKLVYSFPSNTKWWDSYAEVLADSFRAGRGLADATELYRREREIADAGAVVAWPQRFNPDELSAIQHAMNLKLRDEVSFAAEYQNEPISLDASETESLTAEILESKVNGLPVGVVPQSATRVVSFIDVQKKCLYWMVCAFSDDFTGSVIDYGAYPDQGQSYFTLADVKQTLARSNPGTTLDAQLYAGLNAVGDRVLSKVWLREDGLEMRIERCMVDTAWGESSDIVRQFCRQSKHAAILLPSIGRGVTADRKPLSEYKHIPGDRWGWCWYMGADPTKRHVLIDVNSWKSFVAGRISLPMGTKGGITIYGTKASQHRMLIDHLLAEYSIPTTGMGRTVNVWKLRPSRDNHWWDCLVGCAVAASERGAKAIGHDGNIPSVPRRRREVQVSF